MEKKDIASYTLQELEDEMKAIGEKPFRAKQIYEWIHVKLVESFDEMTNVSKALREKLDREYEIATVSLVERQISGIDGTNKFLFELSDGNMIESVLMKYKHGNSICISSQVGCRMGCRFCASTIGGLVRNLTASEMLREVYEVQKISGERISNIVVMGTGEPLDNYDNVIRFLKLVGDPRGIGISPRNISLSTSGLVDRMIELADSGIPVVLTVSLHAATDRKRSALMPVNRKYPIARVIEAARYYVRKTGRRVIFEYALVRGENSDRKSAEELAALLKGLNCHVNLINLNPVKEKGLSGVSPEAIKSFISVLESKGISATLRRSMGGDVEGACGQLRRKYLRQKEEGGQTDAG